MKVASTGVSSDRGAIIRFSRILAKLLAIGGFALMARAEIVGNR